MINQQQSSRRKLERTPSKADPRFQLYKASFRLRQVRPNNNASLLRSPQSPKNHSDFYSLQQAAQERIRLRNQKMINTTNNFYSKRSQLSRQGSADSRQSSPMRRTFYESPNKSTLQNSPSSFNKTSVNFRRTSVNNIYKNQNNDNYLNKYQIIKELGKGSFSTVFLAKKSNHLAKGMSLIQKKEVNPEVTQELSARQSIEKSQQIEVDSLSKKELNTSLQVDTKDNSLQEELVAIKVYEKFKMNKDPHKFKNIRKEINIMQNLQNQGVLKLFQSVQTLTKISLVVEFGGDQSLLEFVKKNFPLKLTQVRDIAFQLIKAVEYLHTKNIVHRDIKLQNVLMKEGKIKLIDFGFSCLTHKQQKLTVICGTPNYMAPEVISRKQYVGEQADIWSYGVVVYALAQGRHPFKAETYNQLERLVNRGKIQFKNTTDLKFMSFIRNILKVKATDRPSAQQILEMNWLKGQQVS